MHDYGRAYAGESGMAYVPYQPGKEVSGKVMPVSDGHGSVFARIEYAKQFTLVPWSRELEGMRARQVTLSWSLSRGIQMTRGRDLGLSR
jgi:glutamate mutase epsilon subunit